VAVARTADGHGYWIATSYGDVLAFGDAPQLGSISSTLAQPITGMAASPSGQGYWLVAADGGVFAFGDAPFLGSEGGRQLSQPIAGIAATPTGHGYWLVAQDGGVFAFGDGTFLGSEGGRQLSQPIVGIAATPAGHGYWLAASDGGVFAFGDAVFSGSGGGQAINQPMVGVASSPSGHGYRLVAQDGGVFTYGDASFAGSASGQRLLAPVAAMASTPDAGGYWLVAADGGVFAYGDAAFLGSGAGRVRWGGQDVASRPECGIPNSAITAGKVIVVSLACQALTAYQDGLPVLTTFITTGRPALPTPPGQYAVYQKLSPYLMQSPWGDGSPFWYPPSWVQYTLWFRTDGFAIHDAPWRAAYGPGTNLNGSHGCVNVPMPTMAALYSWAPVGTPVRVY
jgi:hypothetical protein